MAEGPPRNLRSLQARLRNYSRDAGLPFGRVQRLLSVLVVNEMMGQDGVVKGGTNLEVRLGISATRPSSDLDVVRARSFEQFRASVEQALAEGWHGFGGRLVDRGTIGAPVPATYRPHRLEVKLEYQGRPLGTVTLELAVEEVDGLSDVDVVTSDDGAAIFDAVGLPRPRSVSTLPLPQQIAQKLHACTAPDEEGWINDRAHDLVDLQLAARVHDGPVADIRVACERLFASRRRHSWPPEVTSRSGWDERYTKESEGMEVVADLTEAVAWTNAYIAKIARS